MSNKPVRYIQVAVFEQICQIQGARVMFWPKTNKLNITTDRILFELNPADNHPKMLIWFWSVGNYESV